MTGGWIERFPDLSKLPAQNAAQLQRESRAVSLGEGTRIFGAGQHPDHFLLMLEGIVRVQQVSEGGREIVLYRLAGGESCALTTACLLSGSDYSAEGVAETSIEAIAIPRAAFDALIASSPVFRQFVFAAFGSRIGDLCRVIDEVAFSRIDVRLAQKLLQLANAEGKVEATHQVLATELGTAREVISRQLHEFQRRGWIRTGRGSLVIADSQAFESFGNAR